MSQPEPQPTPAGARPTTPDQPVALRQQQQERLAHLFRRVGTGADDRYLQDLIARYRGVKTP